MYKQVLPTGTQQIVWRPVTRICVTILGLKGLRICGSGWYRKGREEGEGGGNASAWLDTQFFLFKVYINDLFLQAKIGQRDGLSDVDARQANLLYGCAGKNYIYIYIYIYIDR